MIRTRNNFYENKRILITGGAGFIGAAVIRRLLKEYKIKIFNIDKLSYASNLTSIKQCLNYLKLENSSRYNFLKVDLCNSKETSLAIKSINPDFVMHLAAESHVDRSIAGPRTFLESNILGTFNLLESVREHYKTLTISRKKFFRFHHISTDEVFGSLGKEGSFDERSPYYPRSPYSASKASSDHLVKAWHNTYELPTLISNSSNNYGPWQLPDKLIPKIIFNVLNQREIPIYGDGSNIRDWIFIEDHVDALLKVLFHGKIGESYCIGGNEEKSNLQIALFICDYLDKSLQSKTPNSKLITFVNDRLGHDFRYKLNTNKISKEMNWNPNFNFEIGLGNTINWYLMNREWLNNSLEKKHIK